ncbi:MAG: hypothetical protein K2X93_26735 [Candidatus Obscuribacterales bacterium]|nr:hypothetical protein [Candidatus Obscuribacterales bacterium]
MAEKKSGSSKKKSSTSSKKTGGKKAKALGTAKQPKPVAAKAKPKAKDKKAVTKLKKLISKPSTAKKKEVSPKQKAIAPKKKVAPKKKDATTKKKAQTQVEKTIEKAMDLLDLQSHAPVEFSSVLKSIDNKYHDYVNSVINNPIRQFQSTVDEYIKSIGDHGLPAVVAKAIDARDFTRGNSWEQANMNIMNALLPKSTVLNDLLKQAVAAGSVEAVKWYPEASGNPREIAEVLRPVLNHREAKNRWWAAIHLSKHAPDTDGLVPILTEAAQADWIALKLDNSSSGVTGKGEAAKALGRLGKKASDAAPALYELLDDQRLDSADAAQIASALAAISGDVNKIMSRVLPIAERVLTERRGMIIHGGDRELLTTVRNLLSKWHQSEGERSPVLKEKVALLENEIKYHISL